MNGFLDGSFLVFHCFLILFNLAGWVWKRSRLVHLVTISATLASWFVLGLWFGFGYCPCTDWHWQVKTRLGETDLPPSWVKYYLDALTGGDWNPRAVDLTVLVLGLGAFVASWTVNIRDWRKRQRNRAGVPEAS